MHHITVLITRPRHQSQNLCDSITALGGNAIICPTIDIRIIAQPQLLLHQYDIAIFVSANAANPTLPLQQLIQNATPVIAIGPGTQTALEKHHAITSITPTHFSSEGLL